MKADEFIREVDEAVRQERWLTLWQRYGAYVIAAALAIVVGSAAGVAWRTYQGNERLEEARRYAAADELMQQEQPAQAAEAFASLAQDADSGYAVLARLRAAHARAAAGDAAAKAQLLQAVAENDDASELYRQLARLLLAQQQLEQGDAAAAAESVAMLTAEGAPWRHSALELQALSQIQTGATLEARETLTTLVNDGSAPPALSRRAAELLNALGGPVSPAKVSEAESGAEP